MIPMLVDLLMILRCLQTTNDILWITNKLAKSTNDPGLKEFQALMHLFGYLEKIPRLYNQILCRC